MYRKSMDIAPGLVDLKLSEESPSGEFAKNRKSELRSLMDTESWSNFNRVAALLRGYNQYFKNVFASE